MAEARNLLEWAYHWEKTTPDRVFMTQPLGGGRDNVANYTFRQVMDQARRMASYLQSLGFPPKSQIAICSKNCAHWVMADLAIWMAGHVSVPVFPTFPPETVKYVLEHSESKLLFVGKLDPIWEEMKTGVPAGLPQIDLPLAPPSKNLKWDDITAKQAPLQTPVARTADEMATIIYTSGSTGQPKGVMHNFKGMLACTAGISKLFGVTQEDRYLSYLPIAHGFERWLGECMPLYTGAHIFYAESLETFLQDLRRSQPTLFISVPRLWLKFQAGIFAKMPPHKLDRMLKIPILRGIVKKKILTQLGLNHVRFAGSGSAPIPKELVEWYRGLGLSLHEGYGMTENFNYSHTSRPGRVRAGYVGEPYDDVQCRIAEDGEVQVKGPGSMMGYYKQPEETKATFTADGFLRTGDKGEVDEMNRLKLTGRTKEIFKTAKGKYIAPAPIESKVLNHPLLEQACVGGAGFPQPYAVVQLTDAARQMDRAEVKSQLEAHLRAVNEGLLGYEHLQFLVVAKEPWTPENGLLTPTMKIRRNKLEAAYGPLQDGWYGQNQAILFQS